MGPRPVIFISAVSKELRSTRDLVAKTLTLLGYEPRWQDIAPTEAGDLRAVLRKWIDQSSAVIQIVGHRYGNGPPDRDPDFGECSYTQYEALYARKKDKQVWYIILDDGHPVDAPNDEPEELRELQDTYRVQVRAHGNLYHRSSTSQLTENIVLKLRDDLEKLRRRSKQWAGLVIGLLLMMAVGIGWMIHRQDRTEERLMKAQAELREMMMASPMRGATESELQDSYQAYLRSAASSQGVEADDFKKWLDRYADRRADDPAVPVKDKIRAMREAGRFAEARDLAVAEATRLSRSAAAGGSEEIGMWIEAGEAEYALGNFSESLEAADRAARLADPDHDFGTWSKAMIAVGAALRTVEREAAAEMHFRRIIPAQQQRLGPEHADTLKSRMNLAIAMDTQDKLVEAEREYLSLLDVQRRVLGETHEDTLRTLTGLANGLIERGRYQEGEAAHREVLALKIRVQGANHPDTLFSRENLVYVLRLRTKYPEAEAEARSLIAARNGTLGPEHPHTLNARRRLAICLEDEGKSAESEKEFRGIIAIQERRYGRDSAPVLRTRTIRADALRMGHGTDPGRFEVAMAEYRAVLPLQERLLGPAAQDAIMTRHNLGNALQYAGRYAEAAAEFERVRSLREPALGPEHLDILLMRSNRANALSLLGRTAEAEKEQREILAIRERVFGPDHPAVFASCYNLADCLGGQGKTAEARSYAKRAVKGREKLFGTDHPSTRVAAQLLQSLGP